MPLLAFAAARLWEKRDREQGRLTRRAYEEIGGACGSVAHHAEALEALIDARLLTSYEEPGAGGESRTRIEMVHESLLTGWPRLVRWNRAGLPGLGEGGRVVRL